MKIKTLKFSLYLLTLVTVFVSCEPDDDGGVTNNFTEEPRDVQQPKDRDSLLDYLNSHYYNSSFFETGTNHKYTDIIISELPIDEDTGEYLDMPDPANNTLLIDAVEIHTTEFLEVDYEYYILRLNQGGGESPKFTDALRLKYEGSVIESGEVFDSRATPEVVPLVSNGVLSRGTIRAWQLVMPTFNTAFNFDFNNGDIVYNNFGFGVMFIPSGLGYYSTPPAGSPIGVYDNLIFKFELFQQEEMDHDNDGIPSYIEDLDNSIDVFDDDTNDDGFPNFIDFDDDGDGVATLNELIPTEYIIDTNMGEEEPTLAVNEYERSRSEANGVITINTVTITDSNADGVPDYLDENVSINYNEVSD